MLWLCRDKMFENSKREPDVYYKALYTGGSVFDEVGARKLAKEEKEKEERATANYVLMRSKEDTKRKKKERKAIENSEALLTYWEANCKLHSQYRLTHALPGCLGDVAFNKPPKVPFTLPEGITYFHKEEYSYDMYTNKESDKVRLLIFREAALNNNLDVMEQVFQAEKAHRTDYSAMFTDRARGLQTILMDAVPFGQLNIIGWYASKPELEHVFEMTDVMGLNVLNYAVGMSHGPLIDELIARFPSALVNQKVLERAVDLGEHNFVKYLLLDIAPRNVTTDFGVLLPAAAATGSVPLLELVFSYDKHTDVSRFQIAKAYAVADKMGFKDAKAFLKSVSPDDGSCTLM